MNELNIWLPLIGVAMMRPLGAMMLLPLFSSSMLGGVLARNGLALMITISALPLLAPLVLPDPTMAPGAYILILVSEMGVGLILGFSAAIPFWALDMAGFVLDTMRGASMAGVFNPLMGGQSSPLGGLFSQVAAVIFMALGGFHVFLSALYKSYQLLQPGQGWHWAAQFVPMLKIQWHELYVLTLGFAMPGIVMMVLIDLALGLINRSAQQINVFTLSMPIKSVIAILMLIIGLQFGLSAVMKRFDQFDGGLVRFLESGH